MSATKVVGSMTNLSDIIASQAQAEAGVATDVLRWGILT